MRFWARTAMPLSSVRNVFFEGKTLTWSQIWVSHSLIHEIASLRKEKPKIWSMYITLIVRGDSDCQVATQDKRRRATALYPPFRRWLRCKYLDSGIIWLHTATNFGAREEFPDAVAILPADWRFQDLETSFWELFNTYHQMLWSSF